MSKASESKAALRPFHAAFDKTAKARAALAATDLMPINLDVQIALTTVLGNVPRLATFRDAIVSALPEFDIAQFDLLKTYAEALAFANTAYLPASAPVETLPTLVARAFDVRNQLLSDATALAKRGFLDSKRLDELKGGTGYLNTGSDLGVLVRMLREGWSEIKTKSAIQPSELDEAEALFEQITSAYAERQQQSDHVAAATEDRQRAYSLLLGAYDEARRAISYLRWQQDDVEKIAPSLWAGRGHRSGSSNAGKATTGAANAPATTTAAQETVDPGVAAAPTLGVAQPPAPVAVGMLGGHPFTN